MRGGSNEAGYAVEIDREATLALELWGFWNKDVSSEFLSRVTSACQSARPRQAILDANRLKPQRNEGQDALAGALHALRAAGTSRITIHATNSLTRIQLRRLVKDSGLDVIAEFTE